MTGGISATEAIKVISLGTTDLRGTKTGKNSKPVIGLVTPPNISMYNVDANGTSAGLAYAGLNTNEAFEDNTTMTVTKLAKNADGNTSESFMELNTSRVSATNVAGGTGSVALGDLFAYKANSYTGSTTGRHPTETYTIQAVDEFGAKTDSGDVNVSFRLNRAPSLTSTYTVSQRLDMNDTVYNGFMEDKDADLLKNTVTIKDSNLTGNPVGDGHSSITPDGNLTLDSNLTTATTGWVVLEFEDNNTKKVDINFTNVLAQ